MKTSYHELTDVRIEIDETDYLVSFRANNIFIGNDGIGGYEFWGAPGKDRGHDYVEDYTIENLVIKDYSGNQEIIPASTLEGKTLYDKAKDKIYNSDEIQRLLDEAMLSSPNDDDPREDR
jgi:hypothetical protein